jgi:aminopeptidase N
VGWDAAPGEDSQTESLRSDLITALGIAGDPATIAEARARFARIEKDPASLPAALREPVFTIAGNYADEATWEQRRKYLLAAKSPEEGQQFASALFAARDPQLASKNLAMAIDGSLPPELGSVLPFIDVVEVALAGRQGKLAWTFFKAHDAQMTGKLSVFEQPFVASALVPLFWNVAPESELDALIDATPNVPPQLVTKAKHDIATHLAQRASLVAPIDALVASAPH